MKRGIGLIEALVALAILAFGLLGLTRFQTRLIAQGTEAQERLTAVQLGDELLSTVIVDVGNAACYTLPQVGACGSAPAAARTAAWATRVAASLPGTVTTTAALVGNQLNLAITWTSRQTGDIRALQATTDVRP